MKRTYDGNKISAKICDMNNVEYLQKFIYTEIMWKICNNVSTDFLHPALSNHPKINTTNQLLKVNFKDLFFIKYNTKINSFFNL